MLHGAIDIAVVNKLFNLVPRPSQLFKVSACNTEMLGGPGDEVMNDYYRVQLPHREFNSVSIMVIVSNVPYSQKHRW